jgi:flagellar biosynthesis protein FlhB
MAEARRSGHVPRAPLAGFGSALLALLAGVWWLARDCAGLATALLREPLALTVRSDGAAAARRAAQLAHALLGQCALLLTLVTLTVMLGTWLVQGPARGLRLGGGRSSSFPRLPVSRLASALWCVGACCITGLTLSRWPAFSLRTLPALASAWALPMALLSGLTFAIDVAFARTRYFASLWLTRSQYRDEQRADFGDPRVRIAREQARRALRATP